MLSGCLQSRFCQRLVEDREAEAREHLDHLVQVFGADNLYFEVQENGIPEQEKANVGIDSIRARAQPAARRDRRRPLPAPRGLRQPCRAVVRADEVDARPAEADASTPTSSSSRATRRWRSRLPPGPGRARRRSRSPSAATSRSSSASSCCRSSRRPTARSPAYVAPPADDGLRRRYGDPIPAAARERADIELGVIAEMGFESYFLIVWDFVNYAKENGIAVGPGRGSRPARSSPTRSASPTSIRSPTTCCSSGSSTRRASRCRTSTSTSRSAGASA